MNKTLLLSLLLALAAGLGWRVWNLSTEGATKTGRATPPVPVTLARSAARDVPQLLHVVGRAEAYDTVILKARVDGQVASVDFTEGGIVHKGDLLLHLDPEDFAARLRQAQANLARDRARADKADKDVARYLALTGKGFVSAEQVADLRAAAAAAAATVKADQAAVELARLQLGYTEIRAPFEGVAGARLVSTGAAVKVNETALVTINRVQPLYVGFSVAETHLPRLRAALARGVLAVTIKAPGDPDQVHRGEVRFVDNAVDPDTGTIRLKAVLPNADRTLTPGQFLAVSLTLSTLRGAVTIPSEAVQQGPDGAFVLVVQPDRTTRKRPVQVAAEWRGLAALSQGLQAGETVVTDGQSRIAPGAKVEGRDGGETSAGGGG
jgi:multidrug efflux system membrane fusion protein